MTGHLTTVCALRYTAIVQALIDAGADVNTENNNGTTALMLAIQSRNTATVQALINNPNINLNIQDHEGNTALMFAAIQFEPSTTTYTLTGAGADLYLQNHAGLCPADILIKESRAKTKSAGNHQI